MCRKVSCHKFRFGFDLKELVNHVRGPENFRYYFSWYNRGRRFGLVFVFATFRIGFYSKYKAKILASKINVRDWINLRAVLFNNGILRQEGDSFAAEVCPLCKDLLWGEVAVEQPSWACRASPPSTACLGMPQTLMILSYRSQSLSVVLRVESARCVSREC